MWSASGERGRIARVPGLKQVYIPAFILPFL